VPVREPLKTAVAQATVLRMDPAQLAQWLAPAPATRWPTTCTWSTRWALDDALPAGSDPATPPRCGATWSG
jgi:hypothetical protein